MTLQPADFASLHNHTQFSLLDGLTTIDELLDKTVENGQKAVGITDHGSLSGVYSALEGGKERGITVVPGLEAYLAPQNPEGAKCKSPVFYGNTTYTRTGRIQKTSPHDVSANGAYLHQTIWAVNNTGLVNLMKLASLSNQPEHFFRAPRIDFDMLVEHNEGLVVATGCPSSEISTRLLLGQKEQAGRFLSQLVEVFGRDRVFVEIMNHDMKKTNLEKKLLEKLEELNKKFELPLLATNDAHYAYKNQAPRHEEWLCAQSGAKMSDLTSDEGGRRFAFDGSTYYLRSTKEMEKIFPERKYPGALTNSLLIAEMAQDIEIGFNPHLKPKVEIPPEYASEKEYYDKLLQDGFVKRYGDADREIQKEAKRRIAEETEIIASSNFVSYMLTVADYMKYANDNYSLKDPKTGEVIALATGAGRGSSGGSISAYVLGITQVCPIRHDLLFSRFLNAGRGETYRVETEGGDTFNGLASKKVKVLNPETGEIKEKYLHEVEEGDLIKEIEEH